MKTKKEIGTWTLIQRLTSILFLAGSLCVVCKAQLVNDAFCKEVVHLLVTPLRPAHWYRNITFSDSCDFEFAIDVKDGIGAMVEIERFASAGEARRSFKNDRDMFNHAVSRYENGELIEVLSRSVTPAKFFWDESAVYLDGKPLVMLRKKRTVITMFCDQKMLCSRFESLLSTRSAYFNFY